jgi:ethanolamine ammonia-lyase large subunit
VSELREFVLSDEITLEEHRLRAQGADLGNGRGGGQDLLERRPDVRRQEDAGGQARQHDGRLASALQRRLQPNDTRDDLRSIARRSTKACPTVIGDAVIGTNPVTDNVESVTRILGQIYEVIDKHEYRRKVACWRT